MKGLGAFYELDVTCSGEPAEDTGYLINIRTIDAAVREHVLPIIVKVYRQSPESEPETLLPTILATLNSNLSVDVEMIRWKLTPYYSVAMESSSTDYAILRETFEFAAAHRLHCEQLSKEENLKTFGKCNNPTGHGHNYRLEVSTRVKLTDNSATPHFSNTDLERVVKEWVIDRFDHHNLDLDMEEFVDINSSVENIARTCFNLLIGPVTESGAELKQVVVWETEKTCCAYPA